jgi:hypothetical protein
MAGKRERGTSAFGAGALGCEVEIAPSGAMWISKRAIVEAVPEVDSVQTHLEPLAEVGEGTAAAAAEDAAAVIRIVTDSLGEPPRELRLLNTTEGLVAFVTLGLDAGSLLADAHARASEIEERIRRERPDIADVIVHTEP